MTKSFGANRTAAALCVLAFVVTTDAQVTGPAERQVGVRAVARPLPGRYIVVLRSADDPDAVGSETAALRGGRLRHVYRDAIRGFAIELPEQAAHALAADPRVEFVEEDGLVTGDDVQGGATWGLDRVDQRFQPLDTEYAFPRDGAGVHVHVVDTGIRITHSEFGGRASIAADYIDDDGDGDPYDIGNDDGNSSAPDGTDCHGHGTHVAGTIGGATYGVAKNVTLWAHRVLTCNGNGSVSAVIAAVDAITADVAHRPAVANMSLSGSTSTALDAAVRNSILAGVTYVVAAGNDNVEASLRSPARVAEALTVGATSSTDTRAAFSNFGPTVDLFAPGVSIESAGLSSDVATAVKSGTSMAAPHVAGVAALYLEANPDALPADVETALVGAGTVGVVVNRGAGSPNLLLYSPSSSAPRPGVTVLTPDGGEKLFTGAPYLLEWTAENDEEMTAFDAQVSTDGGRAYTPINGCSGLDRTARQCTWSQPGPAASRALIRVIARGAAGELAYGVSDDSFTIASGGPSVSVTVPNTLVYWGRGSRQQIKWKHNLGADSYVRIEISRDGGATFTNVAPAVRNSTSSSGVFDWTVSGPNSTSAIIRVSGIDVPAADVSNRSFTISDPYLTVTQPAVQGNWGYGTRQNQLWQTNLGPGDRVDLQLSADGGQTFPIALAAGVVASARKVTLVTPVLSEATAAARLRVVWKNPPAGFALAATSPANFTIEPPFVRVTAPNGGEAWTAGATATVRWLHNLGLLENVGIDLSVDDGGSYATVISGATRSDGQHAVVVSPTWAAAAARVRVHWSNDANVSDASDGAFHISSP